MQQTSQLVAELQATRSPEAAVRRALERVGEEVSGILQRAHDTAAQITAQSRSEAEDRLEAARAGGGRDHRRRRARGSSELDAETDRIWAERHRIVEDARELAQQLLALAESAAERFPAAEELGGRRPSGERPATELFDEEQAATTRQRVEDRADAGDEPPATEPFDGRRARAREAAG